MYGGKDLQVNWINLHGKNMNVKVSKTPAPFGGIPNITVFSIRIISLNHINFPIEMKASDQNSNLTSSNKAEIRKCP